MILLRFEDLPALSLGIDLVDPAAFTDRRQKASGFRERQVPEILLGGVEEFLPLPLRRDPVDLAVGGRPGVNGPLAVAGQAGHVDLLGLEIELGLPVGADPVDLPAVPGPEKERAVRRRRGATGRTPRSARRSGPPGGRARARRRTRARRRRTCPSENLPWSEAPNAGGRRPRGKGPRRRSSECPGRSSSLPLSPSCGS